MKSGSAVATSMRRYLYVLCRDARAALENVKNCMIVWRMGCHVGGLHTNSLILPASAVGLS